MNCIKMKSDWNGFGWGIKEINSMFNVSHNVFSFACYSVVALKFSRVLPLKPPGIIFWLLQKLWEFYLPSPLYSISYSSKYLMAQNQKWFMEYLKYFVCKTIFIKSILKAYCNRYCESWVIFPVFFRDFCHISYLLSTFILVEKLPASMESNFFSNIQYLG